MAYKTDGTANFNFFINRQGPRGPQGIEGEQGFSPSITEGENTAETYTLQVNNKDGSFTTPNLKPQFQDRGGDVVKVDREHDTLYFGTVDVPDAVDLTTDQTIGGNKKFIGNSTFAGISHFTDDVSITGANLEVRGVLDATSATITNLQIPNSLTSSGVINAVGINAASIKNNQNNKYYLTQGSITAGDNVTIEETTDGVKISSAGGGGSAPTNMVTTDTAQTITGSKTFTGRNTFQDDIFAGNDIYLDRRNGRTPSISIYTDAGITPILRPTSSSNFSLGHSLSEATLLGKFQFEDGGLVLGQNNVTAGSDNLVITKTNDGIKLVVNAPTNAQIEVLQRLINDLSTKVDNLTTRLNTLEEQIDGGRA